MEMTTSRATIFRPHRGGPRTYGTAAGNPYEQFAVEWQRLVADPAVSSAVRRWGRDEPALRGFGDLGQLLDAIEVDRDTGNAILAALLRVYQRGQQLAGRTLLQAMLPKLSRMARSLAVSGQRSGDEARADVFSAFWECIGRPRASERRCANHLVLWTLHAVTAPSRRPMTEISYGTSGRLGRLCDNSTRTDEDPVGDAAIDEVYPGPGSRVEVVLQWGVEHGAIRQAEADMLLTVSRNPHLSKDILARQLGSTSAAALRQRCSRATRALAAAVAADNAQDAQIDGAARFAVAS